MSTSISIDRLDSELLGRLNIDARTTVAELAADLGIARNTVLARLKRLEELGVVKGQRGHSEQGGRPEDRTALH